MTDVTPCRRTRLDGVVGRHKKGRHEARVAKGQRRRGAGRLLLVSRGGVRAQWASALHPAAVQLLDRLPLRQQVESSTSEPASEPCCPHSGELLHRRWSSPSIGRRAWCAGHRLHTPASLPCGAVAVRCGSYDVVVMAFMLFHVSQPEAVLRDVRRVLRPGGAVGLTTWGQDAVVPALEIWNEELDRHGVPPADPFIARHELMDSPDKLRALLGNAGYDEIGLRSFPGHTSRARRSSSRDTLPRYFGQALAGMTSRRPN